MNKKILFFLLGLICLFSITSCKNATSCKKNKGQLEEVKNVVVSEEGVVKWDAVANATSYDVVIKQNGVETTNNTTGLEFALTDLENDCEIWVIAKADKYENSNKSNVANYVGVNKTEVAEYYNDLLEYTIGEKDESWSETEKAQYDEIATYLNKAARTSVKNRFDKKAAVDVLELITESYDAGVLLSNLLMTISTYTDKQIESTVYLLEVYAVSSLIKLRQQFEGQLLNPESGLLNNDSFVADYYSEKVEASVAALKKVIEVLNTNGVKLAESLGGILKTGLNIYQSLSVSFIPKLMELISNFDEGTVTAKEINDLKDLLVLVLQTNSFEQEDFTYILDVVLQCKNELLDVLEVYVSEFTGEYTPIVSRLIDFIKGVEVPTKDVVSIMFEFVDKFIDIFAELDEEFITELLAQEDPMQMLMYFSTYLMNNAFDSPFEELPPVTDEEIEEIVKVLNFVLYLVTGEENGTIEALLGVEHNDLCGLIKIGFNLLIEMEKPLFQDLGNGNFFDLLIQVSNSVINYETKYDYQWKGSVDDEWMQMLLQLGGNITLGKHEFTRFVRDESGNVTLSIYSVYIHDVDAIEYSVTLTEIDFTSIIQLIELVSTTTPESKQAWNTFLCELIKFVQKVNLSFEVPQEVTDVLQTIKKLDVEHVENAVSSILNALEGMTVNNEEFDLVKFLNIFITIVNSDGSSEKEFQELFMMLINDGNLELINKAIEAVSYCVEDMELFEAIECETREQFVEFVQAAIASIINPEDPSEYPSETENIVSLCA